MTLHKCLYLYLLFPKLNHCLNPPPIMAVTGVISPKQYANAINRYEKKKNIFSHATSVGNKQKKIEDR